MAEFSTFAANVMNFIVQLLTLGLIIGIFYVLGIAIYTMATNRSPRWDLILFILVLLLSALYLVRWYPPQAMKAVREGLETSRPEADALRNELQQWLPDMPESPGSAGEVQYNGQPSAVISTTYAPAALNIPPEALATALPSEDAYLEIYGDDPNSGGGAPQILLVPTATLPAPTATPRPTLPAPTATPCVVRIPSANGGGVLIACPPTPQIYGGN